MYFELYTYAFILAVYDNKKSYVQFTSKNYILMVLNELDLEQSKLSILMSATKCFAVSMELL